MPLHVAVAVILNATGEVLIARRPTDVHQGGRWEFPGGKLENDESVEQALRRELHEELGIDIIQARPFIRIYHDYGDKSVLLDVWLVEEFSGEPHGREGQPLEWVRRECLTTYTFPEANSPIMQALRLADRYLITPEPGETKEFLAQLERLLAKGIRLVQFRAKKLDEAAWLQLAQQVMRRCRAAGATCLLNTTADKAIACEADGLHLDSRQLYSYTQRPVPANMWLSASCHSQADIQQASKLDADFIVLSPVQATASHPDTIPIGWQGFQELVEQAAMPVFALGGMQASDTEKAFSHGAQGIAAISALWEHV